MLWEFLVPPSQMGQAARTVVEARDYQLTFADGTKAIDLTSGLWNVNFGYGNPFVAERIEKVIRECHYATLFRSSHPAAHEVAERLLAHLDMSEAALVFPPAVLLSMMSWSSWPYNGIPCWGDTLARWSASRGAITV